MTGFLGENAGTPQAYGLAVDVSSLAIAIILGQPSGDTTEQSWVALSASVNNVTVTGIPALTSVTGSAIQVDVNSTAADGTAVAFSQLTGRRARGPDRLEFFCPANVQRCARPRQPAAIFLSR